MHIVPLRARENRATIRRTVAVISSSIAVAVLPLNAAAQVTRDSASTSDSTRAHALEGVIVRAIRAADAAPIAQKTISRSTIERRHFGQDVPLLLQGASPSLTAHTETATNWGYSYLRLRGLDQTRINITIDGVPLNDMEDQVLYFANFADLMSNVRSVQVQRGVGTSSAGTASYAGSVNFETMPIASRNASGDLQLQGGSFGAQRVSGSFNTGLLPNNFAVYGRAGALRTNGYRDHSGVEGRSVFLGAGWFGSRDIVKFTALAGMLADTLSYVGATLDELAQNRRFNPLHPDERDKFGQQMFALSWTRSATLNTTFSTTAYRNSASGRYDWFDGDDRYKFGLAHSWYGVTSAVNHTRDNVQIHAGVNANTYARDHEAWFQPDFSTSLYSNTGHKQDASAFLKASYDVDRFRLFGDVQTRHARFRYEPDPRAEITERSISWTFVNPKVGATYFANDQWSAFASFGLTSREPTRSDMLAGEDDLNAGNFDDLGDFSRVDPEQVYDTEIGVSYRSGAVQLNVNLYNMAFRNNIAPIGPPAASGSIPRRNVGSAFRRGVEIDADWQLTPRISIGGNATLSDNRIREYVDSSGTEPVVHRNVEPMLSSRIMSAQRVQFMPHDRFDFTLEGRYQSRAFLDNTGNPAFVLPDFYQLDAVARVNWSRYALMLRGVNLGDTRKFGSGYVSDGVVSYFILPPRSLFVTGEVRF